MWSRQDWADFFLIVQGPRRSQRPPRPWILLRAIDLFQPRAIAWRSWMMRESALNWRNSLDCQ